MLASAARRMPSWRQLLHRAPGVRSVPSMHRLQLHQCKPRKPEPKGAKLFLLGASLSGASGTLRCAHVASHCRLRRVRAPRRHGGQQNLPPTSRRCAQHTNRQSPVC